MPHSTVFQYTPLVRGRVGRRAMRTRTSVAVLGGHDRGRALARAFGRIPQAAVNGVFCDHPQRGWTPLEGSSAAACSWVELLEDEQLDAVAFAEADLRTPDRIREALEADKHVYVEPLVARSPDIASDLFRLAELRQRRLWALSPALFRSGVRRLRSLLKQGSLGEIFYLHGQQFVPGGFDDPDLLWGAGAGVVAIALDLLEDAPVEVSAHAESFLDEATSDVVSAELRFASGVVVYLQFSRLDAAMNETLSVVGSEFTAMLDHGPDLVLHANRLPIHRIDELVQPGSVIRLSLPECDVSREACQDFVLSVHSAGSQRERRAADAVEVLEVLATSCRRQGEVRPIQDRVMWDEGKVLRLKGG